MVIYLALICLSCYVIRWYPRYKLKFSYGSDTMFHLYYSSVIRENNMKTPEYLPGCLPTNKNGYPYLYHKILALLPISSVHSMERITGALFDTLTVILLSSFLIYNQDYFKLTELEILIIAFLYSWSPFLLRFDKGPRAFCGTPRVFSIFLYTVHILGFIQLTITSDPLFLVISIFFGSLIYISTIFGIQVLFFFSLFLCFIEPYYIYPLIIALSYLLSIILSKGKVLQITYASYKHVEYVYKHTMKTSIYPTFISFYNYLGSIKHNAISLLKSGNIKKFSEWLLNEKYIVHVVVVSFPYLIGTLIILCFIDRQTILYQVNLSIIAWFFASIFFTILSSIKPFLFLGNGERYLEYSLIPILIMLIKVINVKENYPLYSILLTYCFALSLYYVQLFMKQFKEIENDYHNEQKIFKFIKSSPKEGRIMPVPMYLGNKIMYYTGFEVLRPYLLQNNKSFNFEALNKLFGGNSMSFLTGDLEYLKTTYDVKFILIEKDFLNKFENQIINDVKYFNENFSLIKSSEKLLLYKLD